jgi:hypothetical protein
MKHEDALLVLAAAQILHEYGIKLCDQFDPLGEPEGLAGYRASQVAAEIYDWLRDAERAGVLPEPTS